MGLGNELVPATDPNVEPCDDEKEEEAEEEAEEDAPPGEGGDGEEGEADQSCMCLCFCEDEDEASDDPDEEEEEELVDPQEELKEKCSERKDCMALKEKLDECNARVESREKTAETCVEEIIDFMHCVDHCVSKSLFSKLK